MKWEDLQEEKREKYRNIVREVLGESLTCNRVWSAWEMGTMTESDFVQASDDEDFVEEFSLGLFVGLANLLKDDKYPMCDDQLAQIDCRKEDCKYYDGGGVCKNVSPAITITDNKATCWSFKERKEDGNSALMNKSYSPFVEVVKCRKCGNVFAACVDGYQDDEWNKARSEYLAFGHGVEFARRSKDGIWNCDHPKSNQDIKDRTQLVLDLLK